MSLAIGILLSVLTLGSYASVLISPDRYWLAGILALMIPICMLLNTLLLLWWLARKKWKALLPFVLLVCGWPFVQATVQWHPQRTPPTGRIKVLSYNVRIFNFYNELRDKGFESSKNMLHWLSHQDADIMCLQEFFNDDDDKYDVFNTLEKITAQGYHYYFSSVVENERAGQFGMVIFSRYPIVRHGRINAKKNYNNQTIYVDVLKGKDTLRIYNIHLHSMSIDERRLIADLDTSGDYSRKAIDSYRNGQQVRSHQVEQLFMHASTVSYPVIICGDLNDPPYSYGYFKLKEKFNNAFEEAGRGMGISYNGRIPLLRIDNQFYSSPLRAIGYTTHSGVPYSDHFPISAVYEW